MPGFKCGRLLGLATCAPSMSTPSHGMSRSAGPVITQNSCPLVPRVPNSVPAMRSGSRLMRCAAGTGVRGEHEGGDESRLAAGVYHAAALPPGICIQSSSNSGEGMKLHTRLGVLAASGALIAGVATVATAGVAGATVAACGNSSLAVTRATGRGRTWGV